MTERAIFTGGYLFKCFATYGVYLFNCKYFCYNRIIFFEVNFEIVFLFYLL